MADRGVATAENNHNSKQTVGLVDRPELNTVKAEFRYAIWSQTGPSLVADLLARC